MAEKTMPITGGCLCGAVRYEVVGEPLVVGHCHCHSCRRHSGAPVVTFVMFETEKVRFSGRERSVYQSSPGVERAFCGQCGTPLTWEARSRIWDRPIIEFHISTLDDPDGFAPDRHWFHDERIAWFDVADDLPRFLGMGLDGEEPYRHGPAIEGPLTGK